MKKTVIAVLAATLSLPLLFPDCSAADEEPSWEACGELDGDDNARMCQDKAATYWDKRLNVAYQQVSKNCKTAHCRKKLREAERAWIKYRDLMAEAAGEDAGGYKAKGSMIKAMEQTRYLATKHQTLVLESRLDERAFDVEAGPIWSHEHAKTRCPEVADEWAKAHPGWHAEWTEAWTTTVWGKMSVCNIKVKHLHAEGHKAKGSMIEAKEQGEAPGKR
ncbi:MAG: lysozyme inhibitor LprI family protein [Desulfovibrio sp.]|nr:lysozyme inhibitor LprI family protein [Desulfovibrio sp.]